MSAVCLLTSADVLNIFFVLELLNALVLYSFFFTASYSGSSSAAAARIAASCVYQLTLNFFSSIILYIGLAAYIGYTGGSSLQHASLWAQSGAPAIASSIFLAAFLLKFGTGP